MWRYPLAEPQSRIERGQNVGGSVFTNCDRRCSFVILRPSEAARSRAPQRTSLTEAIANSARVGSVQESAIGSQFSGIVEHLFVKVGDQVNSGQPLATLKNNVA